jgi:hypothetical protein
MSIATAEASARHTVLSDTACRDKKTGEEAPFSALH